VVLRALATASEKHLGQPIVIENRAGAGGTLGPAYMASLLQPFPSARFVPTGGVSAANAAAYLKAGAVAVAMGSSLFPAGRIMSDGPGVVTPLVAEALAAVRTVFRQN